jgi:hypothetical protein
MPDKKPQIEKFRDAVRELGIEDADEAFEAAVTKVAKAPKLSAEEIKELAKQIAKAKHAPYDEMVARAGKGAMVRSKKPLKPKR